MKNSYRSFLVALGLFVWGCLPLSAQTQLTAEQILNKAASVMDPAKGYQADITVKLAAFKVVSTVATKGRKSHTKSSDGDLWSDGVTVRIYDKNKNMLTVGKAENQQTDDKSVDLAKMTSGYSLSLKKTDEGYLITMKKLKSNKDKDAPGQAEMVVAFHTFYPKSVKVKKGLLTLTISYANIKTPISEDAVTYKSSLYPGAKVIYSDTKK